MKRRHILKYSGIHSVNKVFLENDFIEQQTMISYSESLNRVFYEDILYVTLHKRIYWSIIFFLIALGLIPVIIGLFLEGKPKISFLTIGSLIILFCLYKMFIKKLEIMTIVSLKKKIRILLKAGRKKRSRFIHQLLENINATRVKET